MLRRSLALVRRTARVSGHGNAVAALPGSLVLPRVVMKAQRFCLGPQPVRVARRRRATLWHASRALRDVPCSV